MSAPAELSRGRLTAAIVALALGGFAIGTTEFVTMGLLPDVAEGVDVDIPTAGHVISLYALGVVVGAPVIAALGTRLPRRGLLIGLMVAFIVGNALTAVAPGYGSLLAARFVAGLPHGAYFGVASLVAASLVAPHLRGRAVSSVMLGLAVANVAGVPAATWLGQQLGWRSAYWAVVVIGALTIAAVATVVPASPPNREATVRTELGALRRPQVLLTLLVGVVGFGGMFAVYSYVAPLVTDVTGMSRASIPLVLLAFGLGGVVGTALGGRLADLALFRSLVGANIATGLLLALDPAGLPHAGHDRGGDLPAGRGRLDARRSACRCGSWRSRARRRCWARRSTTRRSTRPTPWARGSGGLVIAAGYGYTAPGLLGAGLAAAGLVALTASAVLRRRELRVPEAPAEHPSHAAQDARAVRVEEHVGR